MKNLPWDIKKECALIAENHDQRVTQRVTQTKTKSKNIISSKYLKALIVNTVRVIGTGSAVVAVLWLAPINLGIGIALCLAMIALFAWVATKIEEAS